MHQMLALVLLIVRVRANLLQECAKLYNPHKYLGALPSLKLPYVGDIPIPVNTLSLIRPSPVVKTKAVSVVTKYVFKNPVCVKYTKNKGMCKQQESSKTKGYVEKLVTKEYFVKDGKKESWRKKKNYDAGDHEEVEDAIENSDPENMVTSFDYIPDSLVPDMMQGSEDPRPFGKGVKNTPQLSKKKVYEMLIEDRLDQLETILPHYTRRRVYETSTITVTKVFSNHRATATLMVKNCIPYGYEICPPKARLQRNSKVARITNNTSETHFFG